MEDEEDESGAGAAFFNASAASRDSKRESISMSSPSPRISPHTEDEGADTPTDTIERTKRYDTFDYFNDNNNVLIEIEN